MKSKLMILKPALMLVIFCVSITAALALTNAITKDRIAKLEKENTEAAMRQVCEADSFNEITAKTEAGEEITYYEAKNGSKTVCYIFINSASGYGGDISMMTGILPEGSVKSSVVLDASSETAGLGQNVKTENFTKQFAGKTEEIGVVKFNATSTEINAVTGATISSKAAAKCVNEAIRLFDELDLERGS